MAASSPTRVLDLPFAVRRLRHPCLEALHLGCLSPAAGLQLPEVGGDLASYFDPFSNEDIAEKMLQLEAADTPSTPRETISKNSSTGTKTSRG
jgi:hypothetical protein